VTEYMRPESHTQTLPLPNRQHCFVHTPLLWRVAPVHRPCACHVRGIAEVLTAGVHQQYLAAMDLRKCDTRHVDCLSATQDKPQYQMNIPMLKHVLDLCHTAVLEDNIH
jgi:hypothetical protein